MMESLMPIFINAVLPGVGTLVSALVALGASALVKYVKTKTKIEAVNDAIAHVAHTAETTVRALEQTTVKAAKEAAADGKLSSADGAKIKHTAVQTVKSQVPTAIAELAKQGVNDLNKLISDKIEKAVLELKK